MTEEIKSYLIELCDEHETIELKDIELFKANDKDIMYINKIISNCASWTLKKDIHEKYNTYIKNAELKLLQRIKKRVYERTRKIKL